MPRYQWAQIGVKGVILREGRLLLLHRRDDLTLVPGLWDLPGGGVEVGDSLEDSLVREIREETGFAVRIGRLIHSRIVHTQWIGRRKLPVIVLFYECTAHATREPRLDPHEHTEFAWVAPEELRHYRVPSNQSEAIRKAFAAV